MSTGKPSDRKRLEDIVNGLIRHHEIVRGDLAHEHQGQLVTKDEGWNGRVEQIALAKAMTLAPRTLAYIIFIEPNADLYGVHCRTWLGEHESGPSLLQKIAATVIICRIRAKLGVASGVREQAAHLAGTAA